MILALDSSTQVLSVALGRPTSSGAEWIAAREIRDQKQHATSLPLELQRLLADAGTTLDQVTGMAVGLGPGSFTGLRVGLATAKGLCYARRIPLVGVSSLRALARSALLAGATPPVATILDARHGEIYLGLFGGPAAAPVALVAERSLPPEKLGEALGSHRATATLVGEGIGAYRERLAAQLSPSQFAEALAGTPSAAHVAELCLPLPAYSLEALFQNEPCYVRASDAEIQFPQGTFQPRSAE